MSTPLFRQVDALLHDRNDRELRVLLAHQDAPTIASLLGELPAGTRKIFLLLPPEVQAQIMVSLQPHERETMMRRVPNMAIARFLHFNDEDDATDILQAVSRERQRAILLHLKNDRRQHIEKLLTYDAETAGGLMDLNFLTVDASTQLREIVEKVRLFSRKQQSVPIILVVGDDRRIGGFVPYRSIAFQPPATAARTVLLPVPAVHHATDRERIVDLLIQKRNEVVCVVDEKQRPLGVIRLPDLLAVAEAEATEDVYGFAGVDTEEDINDGVTSKVRRRYAWLIINLATAFVASMVVAFFQETIAQVALLAVFMPLVAGEGGNAGTQALAVTVRGLAAGEIAWPRARRIILRESIAGLVNGMIVGLVAGVTAMLFGATPMLGLILFAALVVNLFVAGLFGALVPFVLKHLNIDPATASSIFVTTATDVFGFLAFLGLGAMLLIP